MVTMAPARYSKARVREMGRDRADRAVKFINSLKHSTGDYAGRPFNLMPWQENELIRPFYGTLNGDGKRRYRYVWLEVARKNGKTEIAGGGFILPMLYLDEEHGAQIYGAANDQMQAGLVFNATAPMVESAPALMSRSEFYPQNWRKALGSRIAKRIVYPALGSFYSTISSEAYTKDGLNPLLVEYDELHAAPDRELWDVLTTAGGTRSQPATVVTTTAGFDRNSICWEQHDYACKVRDGIVKDPTWLVVIYAAAEEDDWTDEDVWRKANPALGAFRNIDEMRALCRKAQETPALEMTFRRLYLNQWVNSVERWLPMEKWRGCGVIRQAQDEWREGLKGRVCYAGLDLASSIDLTALALVFPGEGGSYDVLVDFWLPEEAVGELEKRDRMNYRSLAKKGFIHLTPGNVIDYNFIRQTINEKRFIYDMRELAYDRWGSTQIIQNLQEDGFAIEEKEAGAGHPLIVPFGQGYKSMSPPTKELMTLVLQGKLRHPDHPILNWNADNLVVTQDPAGNLKPDKAKATQKIDGMVALIMGLDRAIRHGGGGPSIYETEGVLAL
jgi:phage terminase large subunit-like protein